MAQKRKDTDLARGFLAMAGLVLALCMVVPSVRALVFGSPLAAAGAVVAAFAAFLGLLFLGKPLRSARQEPSAAVTLPSGQPSSIGEDLSFPHVNKQVSTYSSTAELVQQLRAIDWFQFEKLLGVVCGKLGYAVTRKGGANPDGGIDLVIAKDGEQKAVQCKHWKTWKVREKTVCEFLGALTHARLKEGSIVTLCGYTDEAKQLASQHNIEILDERELAKILEIVDARHDPEILSILRETTKYCPRCEKEMVLRTAGRGPSPGSRFWGCSAYPKCRFTMPA